MLKIEEFINQHKYEDWATLLTQPPYNLLRNEDDDYILFKYNQLDVADGGSDFNEPIVCEARGIIINKHTLKAVALSFPKFWNVQEEPHAKINWKNAKVQSKIDGSKILCWYNKYKNKWQLSTSGVLDAYQAIVNGETYSYGDLFDEALKNLILKLKVKILNQNESIQDIDFYEHLLEKNFCYTFELVSPKARIVVPYNKTEIYFIGIRDINTFEEKDKDVSILTDFVKTPKEYQLKTLEDCLKATEKMGFDEEGFVVVDDNWNRVKIKSPAYVAVHHLRFNGNISNARILELVERDEYQELLKYYPEYQESVDKVNIARNQFNERLKTRLLNLKNELIDKYHLDRKTIAEYIKMNDSDISGFLFKFIDTDLIKLFIETEWDKLPKNKKLKYLGFKEEEDADEFKEE